jgi:hypothetical protein
MEELRPPVGLDKASPGGCAEIASAFTRRCASASGKPHCNASDFASRSRNAWSAGDRGRVAAAILRTRPPRGRVNRSWGFPARNVLILSDYI